MVDEFKWIWDRETFLNAQTEEKPEEIQNNNKKFRQRINTYRGGKFTAIISIITLSTNGLNTPIKCHFVRLDKSAAMCCLQENHINCKDTDKLREKTWKGSMLYANTNHKVAQVFYIKIKRADFIARCINGIRWDIL